MLSTISPISQINFEELKAFVEKRKHYLKDKENLISLYEGEKGINNDYKGRQLLELIQNADDAESSIVKIIIDTKESKLQIINEGIPFSFGGYQSLMVPNLSTKRKKKYIGNKGLGFRSILNWSKKVTISSGGCVVSFSPEFAKQKFEKLYSIADQKSIIEEFYYADGVTPFPVFALPDISKSKEEQSQTIIEINYYKVLDATSGLDADDLDVGKAILDQINDLRKEVLLFLNFIKTIYISVDGEIKEYKCDKGNLQNNIITIDNNTWKVYDNKVDGKDPILPEKYKSPDVKEEESFSFKIAIQEGLKDNVNKLFSFFPTKIGLNFPMIIHGTFELDSSRNRIIDSGKNKFLIKELQNLIFQICDTYFEGKASWDKFRFLNYNGNKDSILEEFGFYNAINEKIKTASLLPCIDGTYRPYSTIKFHTSEFPELIEELGQVEHFLELLQKIPEDVLPFFKSNFPNYFSERKYTDQLLKSKAELIAKTICKTVSFSTYAKWISFLSYQVQKTENHLSVLFNKDRELIASQNTIFTPPSSKGMVNVPAHIEIDYLNKELYDALIRQFAISDDENKSRKLKDKLDSFINIQSFEPAPVLTKIVTNTNKLVNDYTLSPSDKKEYVKAMLKSLFEYYNLSNKAKDSQIRTNNIPIINELGHIINANESFLSEKYITGELRLNLLGSLYESRQLVAQNTDLGFSENENIEDFLVDFLGVNKFVHIEKMEESTKFDQAYLEYVFKLKPKPERFRQARISASQIKNLNLIESKLNDKSLSREQFLAWICIDVEIKEKLHSASDTDFRYDSSNQSFNVYSYKLQDVPSFIRYQLSSLGLFEDYLLNDLSVPFINDFDIDYKSSIFQKHQLDSTTIKEVLTLIGAKTDFNNLSIGKVENILKTLTQKDSLGKHARKLYLAAIEHFKENQINLKNLQGLELHCTKEKKKQYLPFEQVSYVNNISLPRKVLNETAVFNYPKRSGEKNVSSFFKVKTLEDINYKAGEFEINSFSTHELNGYLKIIRPYILVYRLQKLKTEIDIKEAIRIVKSINIKLCSELTHTYNGVINAAEQYDFVVSNDDKLTYLVKYNLQSKIDVLKNDSILSDIVSEIYSISFDSATIRDEIRDIFRNNLNDTNHKIVENFGEENLLNAKSKLEITDGELKFWEILYKLKGISERFLKLEDETDFRKNICSEFQIEYKHISRIDFDILKLQSNSGFLHDLFVKLNISVSAFNERSGQNLSFFEYHLKQAYDYLSKIKEDFNYHLWKQFSEESIEVQKSFIEQITSFDSLVSQEIAEQNKHVLQVNYEEKINSLIDSKYNLSITERADNLAKYLAQYEANKKVLGLSEDQVNFLSTPDRSILYFNVNEDVLKDIRDKISLLNSNNNDINDLEQEKNQNPINENVKEINDLKPTGKKGKLKPQNSKAGKKFGSGSFNNGNNDANISLGKKCEEEVLKALKDKFTEENVIWLSGYSNHPEKWDGYGYDMKYRENKDSDWQFVEVKAFYKNQFYFSKTELTMAIEYPERYFLYLVNEEGIFKTLFKELLNDNFELNYENEFFNIEIEEYKFTKN